MDNSKKGSSLSISIRSINDWSEIPRNERLEEDSTDLIETNEYSKKFLPTIPRHLKSLIGKPIGIGNKSPREVIELVDNRLMRLLGNVLGIADYKTNMISFWFLDTLALQVLRYKTKLDHHYTSVLISWLIGEMNLIRDKKLSRKAFADEMNGIFRKAAEKVDREKKLSYWEEIVDRIMPEEPDRKHTMLGETQSSLILKESKSGAFKKSAQRRRSKDSKTRLNRKNDNLEQAERLSPIRGELSFSTMDPCPVLNIVIDSTYDMYLSEFRYNLIYAAFVEPVEIQNYHLPFTLRTPLSQFSQNIVDLTDN